MNLNTLPKDIAEKLYNALYTEALKTSCKESVDEWCENRSIPRIIMLIDLTSDGEVEHQMLDWGYTETTREYWQAKWFISALVQDRFNEILRSVENEEEDQEEVRYFLTVPDLYKNRYGFKWNESITEVCAKFGLTTDRNGLYRSGDLVLSTKEFHLHQSFRMKWMFLKNIKDGLN